MLANVERIASNAQFGEARAQRLADLIVAVAALLIVGWAMLLVALLIRCDSRGPVFFVQQRLGRHRRPFNCIKFRTMRVDAERDTGPVWATRTDPRITRVGHLLRRSRLDELPQLFNVLRGDMAIVGPRPIRQHFAEELSALDSRFERRFQVKPGLTGWAQISLEYPSTVEAQLEKLNYDLYYIEHRSLWFDLRIMALTCGVVLGLRGS
ncbi:MAG TPA: sugar transferase [Geminicoccaceae bacterium]|nr:sugar transferase [Geminicoccaceae bacterium]